MGSEAAELGPRHERYGEASQVVCEDEALLERRIGAEVGWLVGAGACDECDVDELEDVRESGIEKEENAQGKLAESRDDERAMSKDVAGGEMFEYGEVNSGGRLYLAIVSVWCAGMRLLAITI